MEIKKLRMRMRNFYFHMMRMWIMNFYFQTILMQIKLGLDKLVGLQQDQDTSTQLSWLRAAKV